MFKRLMNALKKTVEKPQEVNPAFPTLWPTPSTRSAPPTYIIRPGRYGDVDWILELFAEGMRDGHYRNLPLQNIRTMLGMTLDHGAIRREVPSFPAKDEIIQTWLDVIVKDGNLAGFLFSSKKSEGSEEIEIYQLSVSSEFRRQGLAGHLIDFVIKQHDPDVVFYARCRPISEQSFSLLLSRGFKHTRTQPGGTRELHRYPKSQPS